MKNAPQNTLDTPATLEQIGHILQTVTDAARSSGMDDKNVWKLETSLDEACTNIVCYGYKDKTDGKILIHWETIEDRFIVTLEDNGAPFDQSEPTHPDFTCDICKREVGGLGRYIMTQFLDDLSYQRLEDGNRLRMVKNLHSEEEEESVAS